MGQPDRVPPLLAQLRRRPRKHLEIPVSLLQEWWRSVFDPLRNHAVGLRNSADVLRVVSGTVWEGGSHHRLEDLSALSR
ncbi:UNVERIFIED_CONTAM: hypothetical protein GTU68_051157 [Idotea baltica]|nr:hypothetical protein [Idotea baltica]